MPTPVRTPLRLSTPPPTLPPRPRGRGAGHQGRPAAVAAPAPHELAPTPEHPLRVRARRMAAATRIEPHRHDWAQVAWSAAGVLSVSAGNHSYMVPPSRAVWIPPGVEHVVTVVEDAELRTLYLWQPPEACGPVGLAQDGGATGATPTSGAAAATGWRGCRVLEVSPLLRELVEQLVELPADTAREACLVALVQDELARARPVPLGVGLPADKRLRTLCEAVLDDPARHATLAAWAAESGASVRTVARLFRAELGTTFAEWRQQVLLAKALALAARKRPMALIAAELGYASASAFTAMVRRSVGQPPSRFFNA
jgi:AraC-like DNA-binding protein/quercetin dioxygenase-like cupin family protein